MVSNIVKDVHRKSIKLNEKKVKEIDIYNLPITGTYQYINDSEEYLSWKDTYIRSIKDMYENSSIHIIHESFKVENDKRSFLVILIVQEDKIFIENTHILHLPNEPFYEVSNIPWFKIEPNNPEEVKLYHVTSIINGSLYTGIKINNYIYLYNVLYETVERLDYEAIKDNPLLQFSEIE